MALNNTYITAVGSWNQLRLVWTATQNTANNTSTVTAKLYWETKGGNGRVTASSPNSGSITIDGTTSTFTATSYLNAGSSKLLHTSSKVVSHSSTGTKTLSVSGSYDIGARLSGVDYGVRTVSGSDPLNTIPRESLMSGGMSFTAGNNTTLSVTRYSSSFNHQIDIAIQRTDNVYDLIKTISLSSSQTSGSSSFSLAQTEEIIQHLAGRSSASTRMTVRTYSGSTLIGSSSRTGTVTAPRVSTPTSSFDQYRFTDESMVLPISRVHSNVTHTVAFKFGSLTRTFTGVGTSVTWSPNASELNTINSLIGTSTYVNGQVEITSYWGSRVIRSPHVTTIQYHLKSEDSAPTFSASQIAYSDTNPTTSTLTGNNQYIIQGKSRLRAQIVSAATPKNGATIARYIITVAGVSKTQTTTGYNTIGTVNITGNTTLIVKAVDSRGFSTTVSKTVRIIPYAPPAIKTNIARQFGYESTTNMEISGSISPITIGTNDKNSVQSAYFQYRLKGNSSYTSSINYSITQDVPYFNSTAISRIFSNTSTWEIKTVVSDLLGSSEIVEVLEVGQPLFYWDAIKRSIGFNDFPTADKQFMLNGQLVFGANMWGSNPEGGGVGGAMNLNNSDIFGANGIYMHDRADNNGEGINFLKTGSTSGSPTYSDYDNFRILDGVVMVSGRAIALAEAEVHWTGYSFVHETVSIPLVRPLAQCPNGLILIWSRYFEGAPVASDWNITIIPRDYNSYAGGSGMWCPLIATGTSATTPTMCYKYIYPRATTLNGHTRNNTGVESGQVLRTIITF